MPQAKAGETSYIQHLSFRRRNCPPGLRLACKALNSRAAGPGCVFCAESTYSVFAHALEKPVESVSAKTFFRQSCNFRFLSGQVAWQFRTISRRVLADDRLLRRKRR